MGGQRQTRGGTWSRIAPYALLSLGSFLAGLLLVAVLLGNARLLVSLGLVGRFFYLVLLPLGLAVAGFLFGALRSYAVYRGNHAGGILELGGPIVGFALVVIGGFLLPPPETTFPLTIYVHAAGARADLPLRGRGALLLDLGYRRRAPIDEQGQVFVPEVPSHFRGESVNIALDADGYELAGDGQLRLDGSSAYVSVRRKPARAAGDVVDESGRPVAGATVRIAGLAATSDSAGHFELVVPSERMSDEMFLTVEADGYQPWRNRFVPNGGAPAPVLVRENGGVR